MITSVQAVVGTNSWRSKLYGKILGTDMFRFTAVMPVSIMVYKDIYMEAGILLRIDSQQRKSFLSGGITK